MIPLRDTQPSNSYPVVNVSIIAINIGVFLIQMAQGSDLDRFIYINGLVPARYSNSDIGSYFPAWRQFFSIFSYMFLHGGFLHIIGNMWSLYIFGDNIEDRLGPLRYLCFYLLCGILSGLFHLIINFHSNIPTIGASGAIAGVMGAYFILYPGSKILTLIPIIVIPYFIEIPAFVFLGIWFLFQFIHAAGNYATGIAWWAHIGGFICGIVLLKTLFSVPSAGFTERLRTAVQKKKTYHLQVIKPEGGIDEANLYGIITITPYEAHTGTYKLVNIPWGFHPRLFKIYVPPNTANGDILTVKGLGRITTDGYRGDLFLKVNILV